MRADKRGASRHTAAVERKPWLRTLFALGLAAACGPRLVEDDQGEERFRRCTFIVGTGLTADGTPRRTDFGPGHTHELCTCSTEEEAFDFSPGGYREYINERGLEMCKELAKEAELVTDDCQESYERQWFTLGYGHGPGNSKELQRCDEDEATGCQSS